MAWTNPARCTHLVPHTTRTAAKSAPPILVAQAPDLGHRHWACARDGRRPTPEGNIQLAPGERPELTPKLTRRAYARDRELAARRTHGSHKAVASSANVPGSGTWTSPRVVAPSRLT